MSDTPSPVGLDDGKDKGHLACDANGPTNQAQGVSSYERKVPACCLTTIEEVRMVAEMIADLDLSQKDIYVRTDFGPGITFCYNTNDLYAWGYACCDFISPSECDAIRTAHADIDALDKYEGDYWALLLHRCRTDKRQPQGARFAGIPRKIWPLFIACGEHREGKPGNPYASPTEAECADPNYVHPYARVIEDRKKQTTVDSNHTQAK